MFCESTPYSFTLTCYTHVGSSSANIHETLLCFLTGVSRVVITLCFKTLIRWKIFTSKFEKFKYSVLFYVVVNLLACVLHRLATVYCVSSGVKKHY